MNRRSIVIAATVLLAIVLPSAVLAIDPFEGTWKLNIEKSTIFGTPPKSQIIRIEPIDNGLRFESDAVSSEGKVRHSQWTELFNGMFRPDVAIPARTVAYIRVDANTIERVTKEEGKEVGRSLSVVSTDGKIMISTQKAKNAQGQEVTATSVYDKQ
jgi:hypothetical protein